jgi:isopentenyl phosphate kinase
VIKSWDLTPLRTTLEAGLLPVVYGDVAIDDMLGGTILSTEDLFVYLAGQLLPDRILIAGQEPGVWADYPQCTRVIKEITPADRDLLNTTLQGSRVSDVTGGMSDKVRQMLALIEEMPQLIVQIFPGEDPAQFRDTLQGAPTGTTLRTSMDPFNS